MSNTATNQFEIESPVSYKVDAYRVRFGIVLEIKNGRCHVQFQAQTNSGKSTDRETCKTWIAAHRLTAWTTPLRLTDGMTLHPSGLEYFTPRA
jgi:hypothetical protein